MRIFLAGVSTAQRAQAVRGTGYNALMADNQETKTADAVPEPDTGLKRLLTYTFITLVLSVLAAFGAVSLVVRWFDK
jgi:hypothetical protein